LGDEKGKRKYLLWTRQLCAGRITDGRKLTLLKHVQQANLRISISSKKIVSLSARSITKLFVAKQKMESCRAAAPHKQLTFNNSKVNLKNNFHDALFELKIKTQHQVYETTARIICR
jgi:hypothetical protein